jgi:hypothetical protein
MSRGWPGNAAAAFHQGRRRLRCGRRSVNVHLRTDGTGREAAAGGDLSRDACMCVVRRRQTENVIRSRRQNAADRLLVADQGLNFDAVYTSPVKSVRGAWQQIGLQEFRDETS